MNTANLLPYFLAESSEVRPTTATNHCLLVLEVLNAYLFQGKKKLFFHLRIIACCLSCQGNENEPFIPHLHILCETAKLTYCAVFSSTGCYMHSNVMFRRIVVKFGSTHDIQNFFVYKIKWLTSNLDVVERIDVLMCLNLTN